MKIRLFLVISMIVISVSAFGQGYYRNAGGSSFWGSDNEVRLNLLSALLGLPEVSYERYLGENMGVGATLAFSVESYKNMTLRSMFLPYYRLYFGQQKADGFFMEGNMALVNQKRAATNYYYDDNGNPFPVEGTISATSFGFGISLGYKLLTRSGVSGEFCLGVGRLFGQPLTDAYPRIGICIGKRF